MKEYKTVSDLYPNPWLHPDDLAGRTFTLHVVAATIEMIRNPRTNQEEPKIVLQFHRAKKRLILNKTQSFAMVSATGTEEFAKWAGHTVSLSPGRTHNGQDTIVVGRVETEMPNGSPQTQAQPEEEDEPSINEMTTEELAAEAHSALWD